MDLPPKSRYVKKYVKKRDFIIMVAGKWRYVKIKIRKNTYFLRILTYSEKKIARNFFVRKHFVCGVPWISVDYFVVPLGLFPQLSFTPLSHHGEVLVGPADGPAEGGLISFRKGPHILPTWEGPHILPTANGKGLISFRPHMRFSCFYVFFYYNHHGALGRENT